MTIQVIEGIEISRSEQDKELEPEAVSLVPLCIQIYPGDFSEVCRTFKKLMTDLNIAVAVEAIQAIGNLALGLRTHFSASSRFLLFVLLMSRQPQKTKFLLCDL
ncbi:hypothetical protein QN277_024768 [Acacia crassicarpa]|uniref:Uncharacterized protein n=1 Tax=Acacia crassicarpa TaxID=499986 RepID=A0AAE1JGR2_9FABA|nr:hypothetical protein QN277_024768 [Acacia crassicarpa]